MTLADAGRLWGSAAGRCTFPTCRLDLAPELPIAGRLALGERAHVIARSPHGPRGTGSYAGEDRYENLILLCPTHHRLVDAAPEDHPVELLLRWKQEHEQWVRERLRDRRLRPVIWDVPFPRNHMVRGRDGEIDKLADRLATRPIQVLYGLPGVGKSQLAVHFAYDRSADYELVYWVDSAQDAIITDSMRRLAVDLDLPEAIESDEQQLRRAVRGWLQENDRWLLIFDRAREPRQLEPWLATPSDGHVLVTSLDPAWGRLGEPHRVDALRTMHATAYLLDRTSGEEPAVAERLAIALGGLPLALEQAASYAEACETTLAHYLDLFELAAATLLASEPEAEDYDNTVAVTVGLAIASIDEKHHPQAFTLLRAISFIDASWLERTQLVALARELQVGEPPRTQIEADLAVGALAGRSVIVADPDRVRLHALVQHVVRAQIAGEETRWLTAIQTALREILVGDAQLVESVAFYSSLLPHILAVCDHAERLVAAGEDTAHLLDRAATFLQARGQFNDALDLFQRASTIARNTGLPREVQLTFELNLASLLCNIRPEEGINRLRALLAEVGESASSEPRLDILRAEIQQELALFLWKQGDLTEAQWHLQSALASYRRVVPEHEWPDSKNVLDAINNAALFAWTTGDYPAALDGWSDLLDLIDRGNSPDPVMRARALSNLGVVHENLGHAEQAERHHRDALKLRGNHLPSDHPDVINSTINLGGAMRLRGQQSKEQSEAASCFKQALELHEEAERLASSRHGQKSVEVAHAVNNQALDLWRSGDPLAALAPADRALTLRRGALGDGHTELIQSLVNLGLINLESGRLRDANVLLLEAREQLRRSDLPARHRHAGASSEGLGRIAVKEGDLVKGRELLQAAVDTFAEVFGPDHPTTESARRRLVEEANG